LYSLSEGVCSAEEEVETSGVGSIGSGAVKFEGNFMLEGEEEEEEGEVCQ
jgi:hypothetical protein